MADSTRRSGRATKGQHSRALEPEDVPTPPKRGGKGNKSKRIEPTPPPEEEQEAVIRCICGYVVEDEDDERKMICCESCDAWQHNECMGMSDDDDELPEKYYCEQCRPKEHRELLAQIARGEKPWEERQRQRELEEQSKKGRKVKGKKGRKPGRPSAVQKESFAQENGAMDDSAMDVDPSPAQLEQPAEVDQPPQEEVEEEKVEEEKVEEMKVEEKKVEEKKVEEMKVEEKKDEEKKAKEKVESTKRKLPEEPVPEAQSPSQAGPPSKTRKITSPITETPSLPPPSRRKSGAPASKKRDSTAGQPQLELVEQPSDLQSDERQRVATALVKLFKDLTKQAEKQGAFSLPKGQKVDEFGNKLGLLVEQAIFMNFWSGTGKAPEAYANKFRSISHNAKKNPSLRDRVLSGSLSPSDFSKMEPKDMASEELQEMKEEMLKEAEKQHVLIQEEGPRMRRTHKGEELIEDESHIADTMDSAFVAPLRKRPSEIDSSAKQASPETETPHSPAAVELPETFGAGSATNAQPLVIDTGAEPRVSAAPERKSANIFNIQEVWQGVKGPDPETQRTRQASRPSEPLIQQPQGSGVKADPEIDQLLKDEEPEDEEPYSPIDYTAEPGSNIWHGKLAMAGIASFHGTGRHVAGADLSATLPWHTLIPSSLTIEGRISTERAEEYLCSLKWSTTTDVIVIAVIPNSDAESQVQFDKLFTYFTERKRYGVIGKSPVPSVKDTYVVTLDAGAGKKPDFVEMLEYCIIEDPRPERTLLLTFAVKLNNSPSAQQTPRHTDTASIASPIGASGPQASNMGQHPGFQNSPTTFPTPQHLPPYASSPTQAQHAYMPPHHPSPYTPQQQQYGGAGVTGIDAARQALGELASAPVVSELLKEAPSSGVAMGVPEFLVIRELLQNVPAAREDLTMLKGLLTVKRLQKGENGAQ